MNPHTSIWKHSTIDSSNSLEFRLFLSRRCCDYEQLVLDISNVDKIDSTGMGNILTAVRRIKPNHHKMVMFVSNKVKSTLDSMYMYREVKYFTAQSDAIQSLTERD